MKPLLAFLMLALWSMPVQAEVYVWIPQGESKNIDATEFCEHLSGSDLLWTECMADEKSWGRNKVKLPFDEEYKISLDNRDSVRRALVNITIDGRAVTSNGLILRAGEKLDLERYLDTGSMSKGSKFKFIEKTAEVRAKRKDKKEDGKIVVSVQYEQSTTPVVKYEKRSYELSSPVISGNGTITYTGNYNAVSHTYTPVLSPGEAITISSPVTEGITVEGSESTQRFQEEKIGTLEGREDVLTIYLIGYYKTQPVLLNR